MNKKILLTLACLFAVIATAKGLFRQVIVYDFATFEHIKFRIPDENGDPPIPVGRDVAPVVTYKPRPRMMSWTFTPKDKNAKVVFFFVQNFQYYSYFEKCNRRHLVKLLNEVNKYKERKNPSYHAYMICATEVHDNLEILSQFLDTHHDQKDKRHPSQYVEIWEMNPRPINKPNPVIRYPLHRNDNIAKTLMDFGYVILPSIRQLRILDVPANKAYLYTLNPNSFIEYKRQPISSSFRDEAKKNYKGKHITFYIVAPCTYNKLFSDKKYYDYLLQVAVSFRNEHDTYLYIMSYDGYENELYELPEEMIEHHFGMDAITFVSLHGTNIYIDRNGYEYDRTEKSRIMGVLNLYDSKPNVRSTYFFDNQTLEIPEFEVQPATGIFLSDIKTGFRIIGFNDYSFNWSQLGQSQSQPPTKGAQKRPISQITS